MDQDPVRLNRSAYDIVAAQYAQANAGGSPILRQAAEEILTWIGLGARLLDIGCGPGRDLRWWQDRQVRAFGVDLSRGMLAEARKQVLSPLCQADMRCLPYATGSFAAIWCVAALLHLPHRGAPSALAEMARVLAPGGSLFLSVQKGTGESIEPSPYQPPVERFFARYEPDEMQALLSAAGFTVRERGEELGHRHWLWFKASR